MKTIFFSIFLILSLIRAESDFDMSELDDLLNEKVYTASKSYDRIQDIPHNVIVITKDDIKKYGYVTLKEIFEHVPGMYVFDTGQDIRVSSRGLSASSYLISINTIPISLNVVGSGRLSNKFLFAMDVEFIDRIEIVKGPQSVSQGSNSMLGTINITTDDLSNKNNLTIGAGNNKQKKLSLKYIVKNDNGGLALNASRYETNGVKLKYDEIIDKAYLDLFSDPAINYDNTAQNKIISEYADLTYKYKDVKFNFRSNKMISYAHYYHRNTEDTKSNMVDKDYAFSILYNTDINHKANINVFYLNEQKKYNINANDFRIPSPKFESDSINLYNETNKNIYEFNVNLNYKFNNKFKMQVGLVHNNYSINFSRIRAVDSRFPEDGFLGENSFTYFQGAYTHKDDDNNTVNNVGKYIEEITKYNDYKINKIYAKLIFTPNKKIISSLGIRRVYSSELNIKSTITNKNVIYNKTIVDLPEITLLYHLNNNHHVKYVYSEVKKASQEVASNEKESISNHDLNYLYTNNKLDLQLSFFKTKGEHILFPYSSGFIGRSLDIEGLEFVLNYKFNYNFNFMFSHTRQNSKYTSRDIDKFDVELSPKELYKLKSVFTHNNTNYSYMFDYISDMAGLLDSAVDGSNASRKENRYNRNAIFKHTVNINHNINKNHNINLHISNITNEKNTIPETGWPNYAVLKMPLQEREILLTYKYEF